MGRGSVWQISVIESAGMAVLFDGWLAPARRRCKFHLQRPPICNKIILAQNEIVKSLIIEPDLIMKTRISAFYHFFNRISLFPLILSSLMACAFLVYRILFSRTYNYSNLLWNLFLAWLPYILSILAYTNYRGYPKRWWLTILLGLLWLVFFPNAPYIVTDFYYLDPRPPVPLWFDISLIALFAFTGCFLAIASLRTIHRMIEKYVGKVFGWLFALFTLGLASLGVYLGRFGRYNSWDVLINLKPLVKDLTVNLLNPLDNLGFLGFTLMFTAILLVFYLMFVTAADAHEISQ